jgi:hypothetical protein
MFWDCQKSSRYGRPTLEKWCPPPGYGPLTRTNSKVSPPTDQHLYSFVSGIACVGPGASLSAHGSCKNWKLKLASQFQQPPFIFLLCPVGHIIWFLESIHQFSFTLLYYGQFWVVSWYSFMVVSWWFHGFISFGTFQGLDTARCLSATSLAI